MRSARVPYEGVRPTLVEANDTMQSYVSYFGSFSVDSAEGVVVHRAAGHLDPNKVGVDTSQAFEFREDQLVLELPVITSEAPADRTFVYWNRLSAVARDQVMSGH